MCVCVGSGGCDVALCGPPPWHDLSPRSELSASRVPVRFGRMDRMCVPGLLLARAPASDGGVVEGADRACRLDGRRR